MLEAAEAIGLLPEGERDAAGGPLLEAEDTVLHKFERLQLVIGASTDQGEGTVFITQSRIFWLSSADAALGYSCDFPTISMHAVATDDESFNKPCLYIQLDNGAEEGEGDGGSSGGSSGSDEEEDEPLLPELRLIPAAAAQLDALFQAFCEGAERNPDVSDEDDEAGNFFYNEDEVLAGAAHAMIGVDDVEELVGEDPSRFDDPDGDEHEELEEQQQPGSNGGAAGQAPQQNGGC